MSEEYPQFQQAEAEDYGREVILDLSECEFASERTLDETQQFIEDLGGALGLDPSEHEMVAVLEDQGGEDEDYPPGAYGYAISTFHQNADIRIRVDQENERVYVNFMSREPFEVKEVIERFLEFFGGQIDQVNVIVRP